METGVSSVVGNLLMIVITIIIAVAVLMVGLYYSNILNHEEFIGKIVVNSESSNGNRVNATFIFTSPTNVALNTYNMEAHFEFNNTAFPIEFLGSDDVNGYYFMSNLTGFKIFFNIVNPDGSIVSNRNLTIEDNSNFQFYSDENVDFGDIQIYITFNGLTGSCISYL